MTNLSTTADDILNCTRRLIASGGYNGFSYADISDVVGIRKASIHHHFPTKADLVRELVSWHRGQAEAGLVELTNLRPDPLDQLRAYADHWAACVADPTMSFCICALLASEMPVLPPEVVTEVKAYFRSLSAWLTGVMERGVEEGKLVLSNTPETEAEAFMALVHGAMLSARAYGNPLVFRTVTQPLLERLTAVRR
ncbi:TetR family transcriptional regulator [Skermanella stibiiresistens SB22]|uniref:TetR family transcriptional regulator n=1 Tax=Skermanella stibiiresistens SB22 TaxID=1385369 RepID=W9GT91_9PROT|nr:TetR/AcrR family transcriptional regulator [Skermanella stibiiresistens]EWY35906.1 TetR family transcriptional regulator [Skermanella stibiiresistens SB22]